MFVRKQGKTKFMYFPVTVSTEFSKGAAVALASGQLVPALNDVATYSAVGVIRHAIASTDDDYAVARNVEVEVPVEKNVVWTADVNAGTLATTSVGSYFDFTSDDDGSGFDQDVSTLDHVWCTGFISASLGEVVLNIGADSHTKA